MSSRDAQMDKELRKQLDVGVNVCGVVESGAYNRQHYN